MTRIIDVDRLIFHSCPDMKGDCPYWGSGNCGVCQKAIITRAEIDNAPTVEPKTTVVVLSDDFGNSLTGFYDKGRDMIFTSCGNAPRKWFEKKYKITEANGGQEE